MSHSQGNFLQLISTMIKSYYECDYFIRHYQYYEVVLWQLKPSFLPRLILNWRTYSRRVAARWSHGWAKNQVSTNQNSRNRWCQIASRIMRYYYKVAAPQCPSKTEQSASVEPDPWCHYCSFVFHHYLIALELVLVIYERVCYY